MTAAWQGAALGAVASGASWAAWRRRPSTRRVSLRERLAPHLAPARLSSRLLAPSGPVLPGYLGVAARLAGPMLVDVIRLLDRVLGGTPSVRRRLAGLSTDRTVEDFRVEQIMCAAAGAVAGAVLTLSVTVARAAPSILLPVLAAALGALAGVLGRDWWLTHQLSRRERVIVAEFPTIADLLALAVLAGEAPASAMNRVCTVTQGHLTAELRAALDDTRAGASLVTALSALAARTTVDSVARFAEGLVVAVERGTPLADVLRAQAADVREQSKRALLEAGGRKELQMMVPVVFLILPITVLFNIVRGKSRHADGVLEGSI